MRYNKVVIRERKKNAQTNKKRFIHSTVELVTSGIIGHFFYSIIEGYTLA